MAKVPASVCLVLVTAVSGRLLRLRPTGLRGRLLFWTQPGHLMCLIWFLVCQTFLMTSKYQLHPQRTKIC